MCRVCGDEVFSSKRCREHYLKHVEWNREWQRKKRGWVKRNRSKWQVPKQTTIMNEEQTVALDWREADGVPVGLGFVDGPLEGDQP